MAYCELNESANGVEIYFDSIPSDAVRAELKNNGFRWHRSKKCWYAKQNENTMQIANKYCNGEEKIEPEESIVLPEVFMKSRCCFAAPMSEFKSISEVDFIDEMRSAFTDEYVLSLGESQIAAWKDCYNVLQRTCINSNFGIIFEYALPYESGRRPDVLLVSDEQVLVLEFKMKNEILPGDVDQASAYGRDIKEYHFESREKEVVTLLVLTKCSNLDVINRDVRCVSEDKLEDVINEMSTNTVTCCDLEQWMNSKYEPLPTIVEAARRIMDNKELPNIRRVNSTCIPKTLQNLKKLTEYAKNNRKHAIAFVTGVPGAGKTYLGLQYVYDIRDEEGITNSVYLSGNGPLVKVLTDALGSNVFVKDLHKVENEFLRTGSPDFNNHVIVFDEGQRAWDINQMKNANRGEQSEPDVMIRLAETCLDWCVLLILVGEGQEIYKGENSGIKQWNTAITKGTKNWTVVCPPKLQEVFSEQKLSTEIDLESFDLTVSLRSHLAGDVSTFVNYIIAGNITSAADVVSKIYDAGYSMYYTRSLDTAKRYCRDRYSKSLTKRYGMMSSSKAYDLRSYGCKAQFKPDVAGWFNAAPGSPRSSCALTTAISEFDCQGLEIDMPIVCWGQDLKWSNGEWEPNVEKGTDDYDYRINSYRVLLTRGRDGFIIFIPPVSDLDDVKDIFASAGVKELKV